MMLYGWKGNRRSDVALATRDSVVYPPMGSMAWERNISTQPAYDPLEYGTFTFRPV